MALAAGTRLGPYEVTAPIGAGGMGEVYRATDVTLGRQVAVKVLPAALAADAERIARFEREARTLAALNHPNIAQVHGFERSNGIHGLIMELVEGPTLADSIAQGALPVDEALAIARQLADAIEAAHEQGIIHRDLKPANIKVREDGTVKVLDFGLAKLAEPVGSSPADGERRAAAWESPTITTPAMTIAGVILGTAAYMSPEQAKGRPADRRSDVWAFGAVLFEMLTGRRAFEGEDIADTLASVLRQEPDWTRLPDDLPPAIGTLIQRCLVKDRRRRVADIAVAQFVLAQQADRAPARPPDLAVTPHRSRVRAAALAAALVLTLAGLGAAAWTFVPAAATPLPVRFKFTLPDEQLFSPLQSHALAISPDGTVIVYVVNNQLYRRPIADFEPQPITGASSDALLAYPVFSPDGRSIAFYSAADGTLKRVLVAGGTPTTIASARNPGGMSWGESGIVYDDRLNGIFRISGNGSLPERIITLDEGERAHRPQILPGGDAVLFTLRNVADLDNWDTAQIVVQSLASGMRKTIATGSDGRYLTSGHLVYALGGSLQAVRFDPERQTVTGEPVQVLPGVRRLGGTAWFAVSDTGALVYVAGPEIVTAGVRTLVQSSRNGVSVPLKLRADYYASPRVSRDGSRLAVGIDDGQQAHISIYDLAGTSAIRRLTSEGRNRYPVWSGDDQRLAFQSDREGDLGIFWQSADGSAPAQRLTTAATGAVHVPESWSLDNRHLLFSEQKGLIYSLMILSVAEKMVTPFGGVRSAEPTSAGFSPDGRWVTYAATEQSGGTRSRERGVFLQPFPATGAIHPLPKTGIDFHPVWATDGTEIFYVSVTAAPLVAVGVRTQSDVSFGAPSVVSPAIPRPGLTSTDVRRRGYDVMPGGGFLILAPAAPSPAEASRPEIRVVLNWHEELRRLVP